MGFPIEVTPNSLKLESPFLTLFGERIEGGFLVDFIASRSLPTSSGCDHRVAVLIDFVSHSIFFLTSALTLIGDSGWSSVVSRGASPFLEFRNVFFTRASKGESLVWLQVVERFHVNSDKKMD